MGIHPDTSSGLADQRDFVARDARYPMRVQLFRNSYTLIGYRALRATKSRWSAFFSAWLLMIRGSIYTYTFIFCCIVSLIICLNMSIDLGFVVKCESWRLMSRFFPSKVGGKPAWLELKNIPGKSDLECEYCNEICIFLCQIYAPYEENAEAFHRTIYIFICKNVDCCRSNQNGNLKIFRSQLSRVNNFYPSEPPVEQKNWRTDIDVSQWTKTCFICGIAGPSHCAKCKVVNYCCRAHQVYDWKNGHKHTCGTEANNDNNFLFPEYEMEIEVESDDSMKNNMEQDDFERGQKEMEKYNAMIQSGKAGSLQHEDINDDLLQMASDEKDEIFTEFRMRIDNYPDQILRYDRGGKVLYISQQNQITDIPKCPECNSNRQFEFQIMPQLLNYLGLENIKCLDWGILAVFTCKQSCAPNGKYIREYIWKQDIVQKETDLRINQDE